MLNQSNIDIFEILGHPFQAVPLLLLLRFSNGIFHVVCFPMFSSTVDVQTSLPLFLFCSLLNTCASFYVCLNFLYQNLCFLAE